MEEIFQQINVCANAVVEVTMVYHVNSLPFKEFTFNIKKMLIHSPAFTQLIDKPQITFVLN